MLRWLSPADMRHIGSILLLALSATSARADNRTHIADIDGQKIVVKITEKFDDVSTVRAECVIPCSQKIVWRVLTDYDHLEDIISIVDDSRVLGSENGVTILLQEGRGGLWFFKRDFTVTFRVREVPMAYVGFEAFEGDFSRFVGTWQVEQREEGTWVSHRVEIQPRFFAPRWALRRMAGSLMSETIDGVIRRCLSADQPSP